MQVNELEGQKLARNKSLAVSAACKKERKKEKLSVSGLIASHAQVQQQSERQVGSKPDYLEKPCDQYRVNN